MKKGFSWIILLLLPFLSMAQNLVPNPSFEIYTNCPNSVAEITYATPWFQPYTPSNGSSDYFNSCATVWNLSVPGNQAGFQYARSGNAYAGIALYYVPADSNNGREYIQVPLLDTLEQGRKYLVNFYLSKANRFKYNVDGVGAYFSASPPTTTDWYYIPVTPQVSNPAGNILSDTLNWMQVSGEFIAAGGERYMTIGNFSPGDSVAYTVSQDANAIYNYGYYYIDDVSVIADTTGMGANDLTAERKINVYPNPASDKAVFDVSLGQDEDGVLELYDLLGNRCGIYSLAAGSKELEISTDKLPAGIYLYKVYINGKLIRGSKLSIIK